ncbi:peptidoglycan recognition family protein [Kitasatospora misakiensis]|uniref:Peptidoglycan recognition family protein n=1 Tax=Kitasatospora misakiensis TaxID=67330 RepID=A0ABW0WWU0_9ACTN
MSNPSSTVSRRTLVTAIGATAAALATAPAAQAAAPTAPTPAAPAAPAAPAPAAARTVTVPATRARSAAGRAAAGVRTDFPIHYVGISWDGPRRGGAIRLHHEETGPGAWQPITAGCAGGPDVVGKAAVAPAAAVLVPAGGAVGYDLRLPDGAANLRSTALDTTAGPARTAAPSATAPATFCGVEYLSRAAWGADESKRFKNGVENSPAKYYPLQTLTVHHTDTPNGDADPAATVRAIYEYHAVTQDWGDIGYHFLIDEAGRIYEGRWSGDDGIPAEDANGKVVTAFHTAGFNSGNLGVALLGTLNTQDATPEARHSLALLLAHITRAHGLDPQAHVTFVNPVNGVTKPVDLISGHRDWLATDCPGGTMYGTLPALRAEVAAL